MKKLGKEPRLLPNVMEAIASLKEKYGSTQKQIIEHISQSLKRSKDNPRNVTVQIRRALDHGIHSGLIKQRSGKYTLGLDKRDYAIFRRFRQIDDPPGDCNWRSRGKGRSRRGKRRRRRRSRRRRRGGRKRAISTGDEATEDSESGRSAVGGFGTPEPMDRRARRRRRRRGRKGRRKSRRGRRRSTMNDENSDSSEAAKNSVPVVPPEKRTDQEKLDYQSKTGSNHNHQDRNHQERNQDHEDDNIECGNPECLCSIKQEDDSPRCMSRENNYYHDSYLN